LPAHVSVAASRGVSRIAARLPASGEGEVRIVAPGTESAFLEPLPIDLLDPDDALIESLSRFGVHTVRDLLALPRRGLSTRLGSRVLSLIALAQGETDDTPLPAPCSARITEALDLEHPVDRLQPLLFVLQGMLSRLVARLAARHLACGDLELTLDLVDGGHDARRIGVAAPTHDLRALIRLAGHAFESRSPTAPVEGLSVETEGRAVRSDQLDLFRPAGPSPAILDETLAALQGLCGDDRVGTPTVADDHHPDTFQLTPFAPVQARRRRARDGPREARPGSEVERGEGSGAPPPGDSRTPSEVEKGEEKGEEYGAPPPEARLALRALRPPVLAQVRIQNHRPEWIRSAIVQGRVVCLAGPWRTTGGWWSQKGRFAYDSFDIQTSDGTVSRLRFDHVRRVWEIDAIYD
jgi:protein ImuB